MMNRPERTEYADFYANYVSLVPDAPIEEFLLKQWDELVAVIQGVPEDEASKPPAPGKWSVKEVLGHLCDTERVMSYRLMRFARGDQKELQGFEQDDYVAAGDFNSRVRHDLMVEFKNIRGATIALVGSISPEDEVRTGKANGNPVSVRALAYIIAGHAQNHLNIYERAGVVDSAKNSLRALWGCASSAVDALSLSLRPLNTVGSLLPSREAGLECPGFEWLASSECQHEIKARGVGEVAKVTVPREQGNACHQCNSGRLAHRRAAPCVALPGPFDRSSPARCQ